MSSPLHVQVAEAIRARIIAGELPTGAPIPSEAQLCEQFGASRGTIRTALASLRREGLLSGGQGRPPTVRDTALGQPFEQLLSFSAWVQQIGHTAGQRTIEVARRGATAAAAEALDIDEGDPVVDVLRLRLLDGHPAMLERSTFVERVGRLLFDFDPDTGSLYGYLTAAGVDLHAARHTMDAVAADETDADLLDIAVGSPLLRERRRATATDGTPLEYADDRYRPDRVTFTIDNTRPSAAGIRTDVRILKEIS
ncbi:GntR family transcriptional regulator [Nocardioides sp. NPDC000445]|uniref:GntR family transcriptional regulator n=1 Tax=Nocardioides sp. NPDC000445 TaxID=3154257 RepID=UPI003318DBEB